jgi:hypothetical protein
MTFEPVVALLGRGGRLMRYMDVFSGPADSGVGIPSDPVKQEAKHRVDQYSIGAAEFAPWGSDVVLTAPGLVYSSIYHLRATGQVVKVDVKLPGEQRLEGILGSSAKDNWIIRTQSGESANKMAGSHLIENPQEFLYEVNPRTGELIRRLDLIGPVPGEVACAADGKLVAIYEGEAKQPGTPDTLVFTSAIR